jgi:hypothetical protein
VTQSKIAAAAEAIIEDLRQLDIDEDDANPIIMKMTGLVIVASAFEGALKKCAQVFRKYEAHHLAKGDDELAQMKAERNKEMAEMCEGLVAFNQGD